MGDGKENFHLDMTDDVVRGSIVLNNGVTSWPPNPPISVAAAAPKGGAAAAAAAAAPVEVNCSERFLPSLLPLNYYLSSASLDGFSVLFYSECTLLKFALYDYQYKSH